MAESKFQALWNHPAGLKTIHFWAPTCKWAVNIANIVDLKKPPEEITYPMQAGLVISGGIWARNSLIIKPKNWNLCGVSAAMVATSTIHIVRKFKHDYVMKKQTLAAKQD